MPSVDEALRPLPDAAAGDAPVPSAPPAVPVPQPGTCTSAYVALVSRHPCASLAVCLLVAVTVAALGALRFGLSDPLGGQYIRDTGESEENHAFLVATQDLADYHSAARYHPRQTRHAEDLELYYTAGATHAQDQTRGENVLTVANIRRIAALEEAILRTAGYADVCLRLLGQTDCAPLQSAAQFLRNATDAAGLRARVDAMYGQLDGKDSDVGVAAGWFFDQTRRQDRYHSYIIRSRFRFGSPQPRRSPEDDGLRAEFLQTVEREALLPAVRRFASSGELSLLYSTGGCTSASTTASSSGTWPGRWARWRSS